MRQKVVPAKKYTHSNYCRMLSRMMGLMCNTDADPNKICGYSSKMHNQLKLSTFFLHSNSFEDGSAFYNVESSLRRRKQASKWNSMHVVLKLNILWHCFYFGLLRALSTFSCCSYFDHIYWGNFRLNWISPMKKNWIFFQKKGNENVIDSLRNGHREWFRLEIEKNWSLKRIDTSVRRPAL